MELSGQVQYPTTMKLICKSFRLFDFHICDVRGSPAAASSSSEEEDDSSDASSSNEAKASSSEDADRRVEIYMFGLNEKGESACIRVPDYRPFFYIKVPSEWGREEREELLDELRNRVGKMWAPHIRSIRFERHRNLYSFRAGSPTQFAKVVFSDMATMNKVRNLWFANQVVEGEDRRRPKPVRLLRQSLELFESNIPPLLRFFHMHNLSPSGWVSLPLKCVETPKKEDRMSSCHYEFICPCKELKPLPEKESGVPYHVCSFDIEATSSHGDFPLAKKNYKRLAKQIVDTFPVWVYQLSLEKDRPKMEDRLKKMLRAAFGQGVCQGIDRVYPRENMSDEQFAKALQEVVHSGFDVDEGMLARTAGSDLTDWFSKAEDDGEGGGEEEDAEEPAEEPAEEEDEEGDNESLRPLLAPGERNILDERRSATESGSQNVKLKRNILDWLCETDCDRNRKIDILTTWLNGKLPELEGDQVSYIGSTFLRYGSVKPYRGVIQVVGAECGDIPGVEVLRYATERDLLLGWVELMRSADPDIVIGYNIFGFDYEFLFQRACQLDCAEPFLQLSRLRGYIGGKENRTTGDWELESKKIVIASGPFDMRFPLMVGRFQIDLYTYFRREFNLSSYKLDDVSMEFISDKVDRIEVVGATSRIYSRNLRGLNVGDYIHLEVSTYTSDLVRGGQKFVVVGLDTGWMEVDADLSDVASLLAAKKTVRWGLAKDDVSPQDIFRMTDGTPEERAKVGKYCIQDCNLVHQLLLKIDVITSYNEMARICHVPMSYLVFRGQGIKLTSCLAKFCSLQGTLMPDLTAQVVEGVAADADYEGAIVLPPKCGIYVDDPVSCNDYSSLYPSIIISNNLSQDSKVWVKEFDLAGNLVRSDMRNAAFDGLPGHRYLDIEYDNFVRIRGGKKKVIGKTVCRWAQFPDGGRGIVPSILETILKARKATRKQAEAETDDFMKNILDKRQLAYKITANSIYGQCGSRTSTFYDKQIAASTTATGRKMIMYAKTMVEQVYGDARIEHPVHGPVKTAAEYIYGDTDSVFMTFHLSRADTGEKIRGDAAMELTVEFSKHVARLCTEGLERPMELSYEKTFKVMALLSKKRYAGLICEEDIHKTKLKFMGLPLKRRDNCDYLKDVYGGVLDCLLYGKGDETGAEKVGRAIAFLRQALDDLLAGRVPMDKLTITKALRDYYKNPAQIAHAVLAERIGVRDPGNKPKPGDRIRYVFIDAPAKKASDRSFGRALGRSLQGDCIETPEHVLEAKLKLNYTYYVSNQIMKPLMQLLGLAVEDIMRSLGKLADLRRFQAEKKALQEECGDDLETLMKKQEKVSAKWVQLYLFDPVLHRLTNAKQGMQSLADKWGVKPLA